MSEIIENNNQIKTPILEKINLHAPVIFLFIIVLLQISPINLNNFEQNMIYFLIGDILFFNVTHIAFAYWQYLTLPEVRSVVLSKTKKEKIQISATIFFVGLLPFLAIYLVSTAKLSSELTEFIIVATLLLTQYLRIQHIVYQHMGLSLLYNQKIREQRHLSEEEDKELVKSEKVERISYHCLVFASYFYILINIYKFMFPIELRTLLSKFQTPVEVCLVVFVLVIIVNSMRLKSLRSSEKTYFLTRLLLYPLSGWMAPLAIRFFHGVEYMVITQRIQKNTKLNNNEVAKRKSMYVLLMCIVVIIGLLFFRHYPFDKFNMFKEREKHVAILAALSLSLGYVHFYLDRVMFKMRDLITRQEIGPLIKQ